MTRGEVQQLGHGLYRIYWNGGSCSLASVGSNAKGQRWMAPTNWSDLTADTRRNTEIWGNVDRVELIESAAWRKP